MAVETINDFLLAESGRFANDILQRTLQVSPFMSLVEEGMFPSGMGYSLHITQFGRTLPAASDTYSDGAAVLNPAYSSGSTGWATVSASNLDNGSANNCTPPTLHLRNGTTQVEFNLQHIALESERLCSTDLLHVFDGPRQLAAIKKNLTDVTRWVMTEKFRRDYTYWCANKVVVNHTGTPVSSTSAGGVTNAETFNIAGNTIKTGALEHGGALTNGLLQEWYYRLNLNGAGESALVRDNNAPVYQAIMGMETARRLKIETGYRDDYRWSSRSDELLQSIGLTSAPVLGFQYIIDITPPRWNMVGGDGGTWTKVEPYKIVSAANGGFELAMNPAYLTAGWEDTIIFHKDVIKMCYPGSVGNSSGTGFKPINYRGEWKWNSIPSEDKNPDGQIGYFRGLIKLGAMPEYTDYGVVIRHARCGATPLYSACA